MVQTLAYTLVLGKPVIMYAGIITYLLLLSTAAISVMNMKLGIHAVGMQWHPRLAAVTIIFATLHAIFGLSIYFNF